MWSVVMLSPTFKMAFFSMESGKGCDTGKGLILGPRWISTVSIRASSTGASTMLSLIRKCSGMGISLSSPRVRGSVSTPVKAEAAAVSGLTRYTCASAVPLRPSKFPVKGPQGHAGRIGGLAHANAGPTGTLQNAGARGDHICPTRRLGPAYCTPAWNRSQWSDSRQDGLCGPSGWRPPASYPNKRSWCRNDAALVHLDGADLRDRLYSIGAVRAGCQGLQSGEVQVDHFVVNSIFVGLQFLPAIPCGPGPPGTDG